MSKKPRTIRGTLSNGLGFTGHESTEFAGAYSITFCDDPAQMVLDAIRGKLPEVFGVDRGPATMGHTDWYFRPEAN